VIVGSGVGVDAWYLGIVTVLVAVVSIATCLVLGFARLWNQRVRSSPT